jgi:hypothetical protein
LGIQSGPWGSGELGQMVNLGFVGTWVLGLEVGVLMSRLRVLVDWAMERVRQMAECQQYITQSRGNNLRVA